MNKRYVLKKSDHLKNTAAEFELKDYLSPRGKYPYEDLAKDMESALQDGHFVYLWSVPGFLIVSGFPGAGEKCWSSLNGFHDKYFETAAEAIKG